MIEHDISIESNGASLSGTLCLPALQGSFPVVLMVHGSGPLDRNENTAGQILNIFNTIAHALAAFGIASVRYDKRGCFKSTGDYYCSSHEDFVVDAVGWVDALCRNDFCRQSSIFVLGHSEGTAVASQVHSRTTAVSGLILLCPFVSDFESILLSQAKQLDKEKLDIGGVRGFVHRVMCMMNRSYFTRQKSLIEAIKKSDAKTLNVGGQVIAAKWCRDMFDLDLHATYRKITCPALLVGGDKDLQCDSRDVFIAEALCNGPVHAMVFPDLTHLLRFDDHTPALKRYKKLLEKPVERELIEMIRHWIQSIAEKIDMDRDSFEHTLNL